MRICYFIPLITHYNTSHTLHRLRLTSALGHNATAVGWVDHPVIVLDCVQGLNDRAHTANVAVDMSVVNELI